MLCMRVTAPLGCGQKPPSLLATLLELNRKLTLLTALYNSEVYPVAGSVLAQGSKQIPGALNVRGADGSDYASAPYASLVCGAAQPHLRNERPSNLGLLVNISK
jgi:hypothetical protein